MVQVRVPLVHSLCLAVLGFTSLALTLVLSSAQTRQEPELMLLGQTAALKLPFSSSIRTACSPRPSLTRDRLVARRPLGGSMAAWCLVGRLASRWPCGGSMAAWWLDGRLLAAWRTLSMA